MRPSPLWHSHPVHNPPLLRVTDTRRVQPISQLVGGPRRVMPHETCSEVLWDACALTLGDEPLAGGVEHRATELPVHGPEVGIALHDLVHGELREEPA